MVALRRCHDVHMLSTRLVDFASLHRRCVEPITGASGAFSIVHYSVFGLTLKGDSNSGDANDRLGSLNFVKKVFVSLTFALNLP